jgi:hypothetical protein
LASYVGNEVNINSTFIIDTTAAANYFTLQLKNIRTFPFYLLSLNISLLTNISSLGLYKLVKPMFIQISFITKVLGNNTCGIISLNKKFSSLNSLESDRLITLTFNNDLPSSICVINTLYSIDYINKTSLTLSDDIYKFIPTTKFCAKKYLNPGIIKFSIKKTKLIACRLKQLILIENLIGSR